MLVVLVLVVSSMVTASSNPFSGISGRIGRLTGDTSMVYLLVNTLLVGLFIFVVVHFLPENFGGNIFKPKSNPGKIVFFIALIGISIAFAIRVGNLFIWNEEAVIRPAFKYLFGEEPLGILRPTRILIFLGTSFLLGWLFISVVKIGQGKKNGVDIVIAVILAAEMTHQGLTKGMLVALGQIISIWLLYRQFKREGETGISPSALVWSFGLVIWISAIAFPGQGFLAPFTWLVKVIGHFNYLLLLIIAGIIATVGGNFLKKKERIARWRSDIKDYVGNFLRKLARKIPLIKRFQFRNKAPEREWPFEFRNLKLELAILMNYMLRVDVYKIKSKFVDEAQESTVKDQEGTPEKPGYKDIREPGKQKGDAYEYKVGARSFQDPNTTGWDLESYTLKTTDKDGRVHERIVQNLGWANHRHLIVSIVDHLRRKLMDTDRLRTVSEGTESEEDKFALAAKILTESVGLAIGEFNSKCEISPNAEENASMNKFFKKFITNIKFYGLTQKRDSNRWAVLDQNNVNGRYRHTYKFARLGAKVKLVQVEVVENRETGTRFCNVVRESNFLYEKLPSGTYGLGTQLYEVDERGLFIDDINLILNGKYPANPNKKKYNCRKIDPLDVVDHGSFTDICSSISAEWKFFIRDVQIGRYHPYSRTAADYNNCHEKKDLYYSKMMEELRKVRRTPGGQYPAFDREALKDPTIVYRGKIGYVDLSESSMSTNPIKHPTISTKGLTEYIKGRLKEIEKLENLKDEYIGAWKWDTKEETKKGGE